MAPDWRSPTEDNGAATPRDTLHIALLATSSDEVRALSKVRVITPPLWKGGKIALHVILSKDLKEADILIRQTLVDLGLADSRDLAIGPPDQLTLGYPTGD